MPSPRIVPVLRLKTPGLSNWTLDSPSTSTLTSNTTRSPITLSVVIAFSANRTSSRFLVPKNPYRGTVTRRILVPNNNKLEEEYCRIIAARIIPF
uniref:Uncharacterized protein n=1 Tax=Physcomitrium patens TaxID=3218 RepID=A0A2K1KQI8_PHYPA|nr:hypothetical protein PHYPA_006959 [Physcomitrium patens]